MPFGSYEGGLGTWQDEVGVVVQDHSPRVATLSRMLITHCALTPGRRMYETHSEGSKLQEFIMPRAGANRKHKTHPERPGRTPQSICAGLLRGGSLSCGHLAGAVIIDLRGPCRELEPGLGGARADPMGGCHAPLQNGRKQRDPFQPLVELEL